MKVKGEKYKAEKTKKKMCVFHYFLECITNLLLLGFYYKIAIGLSFCDGVVF